MKLPFDRRSRKTYDHKSRKTFSGDVSPIADFLAVLQHGTPSSVTRAEALSVPAVQRGRNLICSVATLPLVQHGPDNAIAPSSLLAQIDPDVPNVVTLSQTIEDLLFESIAWWLITAQDFSGFPISARHLSTGSVSLQPPAGRNVNPLPSGLDPRGGVVWVDGVETSASRVIRFDSPNPALLKSGRAINRAILLDQAASMYADDPRPLDYFSPAQDADPADDEDIKNFLSQWAAARKARATAYVPASVNYNAVSTPSPQELQLVELQKQAHLEIANAIGVDPEDLGISTTSRTYQNSQDRRRSKLTETLAPYMRAVTDRLSMGDVTRRGYTVRFDPTEWLLPNPTERWTTYQTALAMGAITVEEIREKEGMTPLPETTTAEPEPEPAVVEESRPASETFAAESLLTFVDVPVEEFSVDRENRIIEGLALPYGKVASRFGMKFRFERGALQWDQDQPGRIKLLRDHDVTQALGKAIQLKDTPRGLLARFKVARGAAGDEALELAEDGVLDGLSVGVDFDAAVDTTFDKAKQVTVVRRADWRETSLTAMPSFDDARVTKVAASQATQGGPTVADSDVNEPVAPAPEDDVQVINLTGAVMSADDVATFMRGLQESRPDADDVRLVVDPTRQPIAFVREPLPYRFSYGFDVKGRTTRFARGEHDFSTDLVMALKSHDFDLNGTDAGRRVAAMLRHEFAEVVTTDVNELNPDIQRPDMFVDRIDFTYPLTDMINKGAPPNGVQPFVVPKFNSAAGLVGDHTEGTEPSSGSYTTTSQTITPTALSGKAAITREVWDMGGNPAVSSLIFNQMTRDYREGLESAIGTFLNTLTAATDINLGTAVVDTALGDAWNRALALLQFARGGNRLTAFAVEQSLYLAFAEANDETGGTGKGRPLFPMLGPANTNGTALRRFTALDLGGVIGVPTWGLTSVTGGPNNSWLFDPETVHCWYTQPQRLEFAGTDPGVSATAYAPVAYVTLGIWGYKALANTDINGVRQVIYDPV